MKLRVVVGRTEGFVSSVGLELFASGVRCHFMDHPHAYGWKDYSRLECRFCRKSGESAVDYVERLSEDRIASGEVVS